MYSDSQIAKIKRFLADQEMSETVKRVIRDSFLKPREKSDVYILAAERIAIELLNEAFKDLERARNVENGPIKRENNIGL